MIRGIIFTPIALLSLFCVALVSCAPLTIFRFIVDSAVIFDDQHIWKMSPKTYAAVCRMFAFRTALFGIANHNMSGSYNNKTV